MSIEKIYNMSKDGREIHDMKKPIYPKDDIRNNDPGLFYLGDDGRKYYTTAALNAANKRHFDEYFPIIQKNLLVEYINKNLRINLRIFLFINNYVDKY